MKRPGTKPNDYETAVNSLRAESAKLRCLSHLIESQREPEGAPWDTDEINMGLAAILCDCSKAIREASVTLAGKYLKDAHRQ